MLTGSSLKERTVPFLRIERLTGPAPRLRRWRWKVSRCAGEKWTSRPGLRRKSSSGPDSPESGGRGAANPHHPWFRLPGRSPTATPTPHSYSRPEPGPGQSHTFGSYRKRNRQLVVHTLTQPPSSRKSTSRPGAGANKMNKSLPAPPAG